LICLYLYEYISMNTYCYEIYHIWLEMVWQALSNAISILWICLAVHEILANKAFIVTNDLISQFFVVAFVYPIYVQIALAWGFLAQLSLWKLVHLLWRYKLNKVCNISSLSYKSLFPLPPLVSEKPIIKVEEIDNINSNTEI